MTTILSLAKRRKKLVALQLEDGRLELLDSAVVQEEGLRAGMQLEEERLTWLREQSELRRAKEKALWLLSSRDHSRKELVQKMERTVSREAAEGAVQQMEEYGLIDDEAYARRLCEELFEQKHCSIRRAEYLLLEKGIDRELIRGIIEEIAPDDYKQIAALLQGRYARNLGDERGCQKTVAALQRLGFSYRDIRHAMQEYRTMPLEEE